MRINDIFYSLQGEGHHTGRAAVFVRFAGCNLRCSFCDTEFDTYREMTSADILQAISFFPTRFVVLTGGEPTLQVDEAFVDQLHQHGYEVAMESNGTRPAPMNLDWLTVSPKGLPPVAPSGQRRLADELKVVFASVGDPEKYAGAWLPLLSEEGRARLLLQPCDTGNPERNAAIVVSCIAYIKEHPQWRLSLQTHKLVGFK